MPVIDAVAVATTDMGRAVAFYTAVGFDFTGVDVAQDHVEPVTKPGEVRLMIDSAALISSILGYAARPASHSSFALLCEDAAEVNAIAARVARAGFTVEKAPWDAFWGQRYAVVKDPDGYLVDLFAPL
ncbi:MAG: VOC family protein [Deltaproteobacteria bacterium]